MNRHKVVSFTMVNNECEIIESFVRYNYNFVDEMVVIDNGCTDATMEIIQKLISEGYKITVFDESLQAYDQFRLDNKYLKIIGETISPDILIPLDADEFLAADCNAREILDSLDLDTIYYVHWKWYVMTEHDEQDEAFIPKRLKYRFADPVWNYADHSPVTKAIIPFRYFEKNNLKLAMGHHTVFGSNQINIEERDNLFLAHYRATSVDQLITKTLSYTLRDIATMGNNSETAQRTNQLNLIENGVDMTETAIQASYNGYTMPIVKDPLNLKECVRSKPQIRFPELAKQSVLTKIYRTGQEMAIRTYNVERRMKEKAFIAPIVVWMGEVKKLDYLMPNPSNREVLLTAKYNVRAYVTSYPEISFLKANYRLIVNPKMLKFIPHQCIVVPRGGNVEDVQKYLKQFGVNPNSVVSEAQYRKNLGMIRRLYCTIRSVPSLIERVSAYGKRNGYKVMIDKMRNRLKK